MNRKQLTVIILIAFFVGALGSIAIGRFLIPYLATFKGFGSLNKLATSSQIVIQRTQQVQLNEGVNLIDLTKQAGNISVSFYAGNQNNLKFVGNGIIFSTDGGIFSTSSISVPAAKQLFAVTNDGQTFAATIRAQDPRSNLLIITIQAQNLPVAQFVDAKNLQTAQRVMGIGLSSSSQTHKFVTGFVTKTLNNSASLEQVFSSEAFGESIQTDAAIGSDYFGGPVINLDGKVVGMMSGSGMNIIPAEDLQSALNSFLASGKIIRPVAGIKYLNLSGSLAKLKGLPGSGSLVVSVDDNSPAKKAALAAGDLITAMDSVGISPDNSFEYMFNKHSITPMKLNVLRAGKEMEITINLDSTK